MCRKHLAQCLPLSQWLVNVNDGLDVDHSNDRKWLRKEISGRKVLVSENGHHRVTIRYINVPQHLDGSWGKGEHHRVMREDVLG